MKYWEIIADNLSKAGWSWGCVSAIDSDGRTIWIADAHRDDGKRCLEREREGRRTDARAPSDMKQFLIQQTVFALVFAALHIIADAG